VPSPYSGSTVGNADDVNVCGAGADQGFTLNLGPNERIRIGQTANTFDSKHTLRYGGTYPGDSLVSCEDDPDASVLSYTNTGTLVVAVYFVVDAFNSAVVGDFTLTWMIDTPGMSSCYYDRLTSIFLDSF
jgi:hypothetical protein